MHSAGRPAAQLCKLVSDAQSDGQALSMSNTCHSTSERDVQSMRDCLRPTLVLQAQRPSRAMHVTQIRQDRWLREHHARYHKQA